LFVTFFTIAGIKMKTGRKTYFFQGKKAENLLRLGLPPTKDSPAEKSHKAITEIIIYFSALIQYW